MSTEGTPQVEDHDESQKAEAREQRHARGFSRDRMPSARRNVRINPFRRVIVNMLKFVLPLIAMTILALVVLWPQIEQVQESGFRLGFSTSPEDLMENVAMSKPASLAWMAIGSPLPSRPVKPLKQRKPKRDPTIFICRRRRPISRLMTDRGSQ